MAVRPARTLHTSRSAPALIQRQPADAALTSILSAIDGLHDAPRARREAGLLALETSINALDVHAVHRVVQHLSAAAIDVPYERAAFDLALGRRLIDECVRRGDDPVTAGQPWRLLGGEASAAWAELKQQTLPVEGGPIFPFEASGHDVRTPTSALFPYRMVEDVRTFDGMSVARRLGAFLNPRHGEGPNFTNMPDADRAECLRNILKQGHLHRTESGGQAVWEVVCRMVEPHLSGLSQKHRDTVLPWIQPRPADGPSADRRSPDVRAS